MNASGVGRDSACPFFPLPIVTANFLFQYHHTSRVYCLSQFLVFF